MEKEKIKGVIESILFASGRSVSLHELEISLDVEQRLIINAIEELQEDYKLQNRGVEIVMIDNGYTLASKKEYHKYIYTIIDKRVKPSLSQAALEVLAIIAYNQNITRAEIETIRGVGSDTSLYRLLEHNLIEEAGKLDLPGRPMAYRVTKDFLKKFGLNTLDDLPELPKYKMDENRQFVIDELNENKEDNIERLNDKEEVEDKEHKEETDKQELEKPKEEEGEDGDT